MTIDGNGVAQIIGAVAAALVLVGGFGMQVVNFLDNRKLKQASLARDKKIQEVKELVNGKSEELMARTNADAYEAGRIHERLMPGEPSPAIISVVLTPKVPPIIVSEGGKPVEPKSDG